MFVYPVGRVSWAIVCVYMYVSVRHKSWVAKEVSIRRAREIRMIAEVHEGRISSTPDGGDKGRVRVGSIRWMCVVGIKVKWKRGYILMCLLRERFLDIVGSNNGSAREVGLPVAAIRATRVRYKTAPPKNKFFLFPLLAEHSICPSFSVANLPC